VLYRKMTQSTRYLHKFHSVMTRQLICLRVSQSFAFHHLIMAQAACALPKHG